MNNRNCFNCRHKTKKIRGEYKENYCSYKNSYMKIQYHDAKCFNPKKEEELNFLAKLIMKNGEEND